MLYSGSLSGQQSDLLGCARRKNAGLLALQQSYRTLAGVMEGLTGTGDMARSCVINASQGSSKPFVELI
jgi:hypothetical protein